MKKLIPLVLALGCAYGTRFEVNNQAQREAENIEIQDKYALVVIGSTDIGHYYGIPNSQNPFIVEGRILKDTLERNGFPEENIYFLHGNDASYNKLMEVTKELGDKVDNNDAFVAVISTHGTPFSLERGGGGE